MKNRVSLLLIPVLLIPALLSACASQSELAAQRLDPAHPHYRSIGCQHSLQGSEFHRDAKTLSLIASPALVFLSGGLLLPVVAANAGLDYMDRVDASNMSTRCGGRGQTENDILQDVSTGAALGVITGGRGK